MREGPGYEPCQNREKKSGVLDELARGPRQAARKGKRVVGKTGEKPSEESCPVSHPPGSSCRLHPASCTIPTVYRFGQSRRVMNETREENKSRGKEILWSSI